VRPDQCSSYKLPGWPRQSVVTTLRAAHHKGFVIRFPARADLPRNTHPVSGAHGWVDGALSPGVRRLGAYGSALTIIERRKNARSLTYIPPYTPSRSTAGQLHYVTHCTQSGLYFTGKCFIWVSVTAMETELGSYEY